MLLFVLLALAGAKGGGGAAAGAPPPSRPRAIAVTVAASEPISTLDDRFLKAVVPTAESRNGYGSTVVSFRTDASTNVHTSC